MTRREHLARYPLLLDEAGIQATLLTINVDALALHYPDRTGVCPICGEQLCAIRLNAVRTVRAAGVRVSVLPPHEPRRPQWDCELCDCPWPCSQARVMLGDEHEADRVGLAARMAEAMRQARTELPHATDRELTARFLGWVR